MSFAPRGATGTADLFFRLRVNFGCDTSREPSLNDIPCPLSLAFDTAASETHIVPEIIDDLGYSPRQGEQITSVTSAIGKERGYMLRVSTCLKESASTACSS